MPAPEHLGAYQFGPYLFTKEHNEAEGITAEGEDGAPAQTRYTMARQPTAADREQLGDRNAPAFDAGTMDVNHHPAREPLPNPRTMGDAGGLAALALEAHHQRALNSGTLASYRERHLPHDEVEYLTVERSSRTMALTMLGLGQRSARATTGQDLRASTDLSPHSQRMVDKLKAGGVVPESHAATHRNELTFTTAWPMSTPGGLEGHFSTLMRRKGDPGGGGEKPILATEVAAAREEGRNIVRRMRPR